MRDDRVKTGAGFLVFAGSITKVRNAGQGFSKTEDPSWRDGMAG